MRINREAVLQTIAALEADIVFAKLGCRRRGLEQLHSPREGVRWILNQASHHRNLLDLKTAIHPLYALLAHARGRIHAADNDPKLKPFIDFYSRKRLPLECQTLEFRKAWIAQEAFVAPLLDVFKPTQTAQEQEQAPAE